MVILDRNRKDLVLPKSLGNFVTEGGGGGVTPEEVAEIASAVTSEALEEYNIELEVELEDIREAISGNTDTLLDLATIAAMSIADRVALFDEVFEKASNGEKIYIKGLVQEETIRTAILPLVSYRPETNPVLHQGGNLYFAAKGDTDNVYFHIGLTSEGSIDPTSGNVIKRNIYNLPTASAEVKGGVRIGSGLTMTQDTLSVDTTGLVTDGDLAPFIVQQSANTENIATLSAATEAISESLGNYATTATTDALSAVTSALTEEIAALSGSGKEDVYVSLGELTAMTTEQRTAYWEQLEQKYLSGYSIYLATGPDSEKVILPLVKYQRFPSAQSGYSYFGFTAVNGSGNGYYDVNFQLRGTLQGNSGSAAQKKTMYTLPTAAENTKGGVKVGSGLTMNGEVMNVNIGEGLAFSGDTLVVSGCTGGPAVYYLDKMSQEERAALYDEIASNYTEETFPAGNYRFFTYMSSNDEYQGNIELCLARFDGANRLDFSGIYQSRYNGYVLQRGYRLYDNGDFELAFSRKLVIPEISAGSGISISNNVVSIKAGEGLAFSGDTLVVSGGTGGGGIPKVSELPSEASDGDVVFLEGYELSGYTVVKENVSDWESGYDMCHINDWWEDIYSDGYGTNYGKYYEQNGVKKRFRRDENNLYLDLIGDIESISIEGKDSDSYEEASFSFLGRYFKYNEVMGLWLPLDYKVYVDYEKDYDTLVELWNEIYSGTTDFNSDMLVILHKNDRNQIREFEPYETKYYGMDCQASDSSGAQDGYFGRISVETYRCSFDYQLGELSWNALVGENYTTTESDVRTIVNQTIAPVSFGNDGRGGITYIASNDVFYYDNGNIATGDTQNYAEDLIDYNYLTSLFNRDGIYNGTLLINVHSLEVFANNELKKYTSPTLSMKSITAYTIGDYTFENEVAFKYADWELKIDIATGSNIGANLRIAAL